MTFMQVSMIEERYEREILAESRGSQRLIKKNSEIADSIAIAVRIPKCIPESFACVSCQKV